MKKIDASDIAEFYSNLNEESQFVLSKMKDLDWSSFFNKIHSKLFLNFLTIRKLKLMEELSQNEFKGDEFVQKTNFLIGAIQEQNYIAELLNELNYKDQNEEEG